MADRLWNEPSLRTALPRLLLAAVGVGWLAWAAWGSWSLASFLRHAAYATGAVVDAHQHQRVRFNAANGRVVEFVQNGGLDRPLGAPVPVAYDPADPAGTARADTFWATWGGELEWVGGGLCLIFLPGLGGWGRRRA